MRPLSPTAEFTGRCVWTAGVTFTEHAARAFPSVGPVPHLLRSACPGTSLQAPVQTAQCGEALKCRPVENSEIETHVALA